MSNKRAKIKEICCWIFGIAVSAILVSASALAVNQTGDQGGVNTITGIVVTENSDSIQISVQGEKLLTYTSTRLANSPGVVFYFPDTKLLLDNLDTEAIESSSVIDSLKTTESTTADQGARIEISLKQETVFDVSREGNGILISFPNSRIAEVQEETPEFVGVASSSSVGMATTLQDVKTETIEGGIKILVVADGKIEDYKSFTIDNPARIVLDIPGVKSSHTKEQMVAVESKLVRGVRYYGYPDKLRLVLDTESEYLSAFSAKTTETGMEIVISAGSDTLAAQPTEPQPVEEQQAQAVEETAVVVKDAAGAKSSWLNRLDFTSEESGTSTLLIGTTFPVNYNLDQADPRKVKIELFNTKLPEYRKRPLITTRFESAVDRVLPVQTAAMGGTAAVIIELREAVSVNVEQKDNVLLVTVASSSVPPKPLEEAALADWKKVTEEVLEDEETSTAEAVDSEGTMAGTNPESADVLYNETVEYTGEKIALDFYETDIKNVFRIIREVSGLNFAIDKNVTGKVTLTLEKPVPWDQVLDLVLKMNQLGKIYEGDIVRIATLATIQKEAKARRDRIAEEQKEQEQIVALEPLVTEYISVNYSNAQTEVLPHIEGMITPDRGSISVDQRNNQLIITDTVGNIELIKNIVASIDKVTPQVIIEARIVEANSDFTREVGFDWGEVTLGPFSSGLFGGDITLDFSADNLPAASTGELGFNFVRAVGTPFSIVNARLQVNESEGNVKIISAPKVITLDNKQAKIKQGVEWPYQERDSAGNSTVKFKDIDLLLEVTPHVTPDERIALGIYITKNDVGTITNGVPSLITNEAETELLVNDGDTIVIGGIIKTTIADGGAGIPGMRDLPAIGWLFGTTTKSSLRQELLIFISPRIVQLEQR